MAKKETGGTEDARQKKIKIAGKKEAHEGAFKSRSRIIAKKEKLIWADSDRSSADKRAL